MWNPQIQRANCMTTDHQEKVHGYTFKVNAVKAECFFLDTFSYWEDVKNKEKGAKNTIRIIRYK